MFYWGFKILKIPNLYQLRELLSIQEEEEEGLERERKRTQAGFKDSNNGTVRITAAM